MSHIDLKIVLLGREFSGKTSLVERFVHNRFRGPGWYQNTIGAAYGARLVDVEDRGTIAVGIWDTAGSERYEAMTRMYYRGAKAAILCYDVTNEESWSKIEHWVKELKIMEEDCRIYICANKIDLLCGDNKNRIVDYYDTLDFAELHSARLIETSSKTGHNVEELFQMVAQDYARDPRNASQVDTVSLKYSKTKTRRKCC